MIQNISLTS